MVRAGMRVPGKPYGTSYHPYSPSQQPRSTCYPNVDHTGAGPGCAERTPAAYARAPAAQSCKVRADSLTRGYG